MLKIWYKRMGRWLEKWGYALMCVLCASVILLSALWTRDAQRAERLSADVLSGMDETVQEKTAQGAETAWVRPVQGKVVRAFAGEPVYFAQTGVFAVHPAIDFEADAQTPVCCMKAGTVSRVREGEVRISHPDGESVYRGLETVSCLEGQALRAGDIIGTGGGHVPFEGTGHVCVRFAEDGVATDFAVHLP